MLGIRSRIRRIRMFFGPPGSASGSVSHKYGSGSGSFQHQSKIVRKTSRIRILCCLASRIRVRIRQTEARILGSGSVSKCHGSTTLVWCAEYNWGRGGGCWGGTRHRGRDQFLFLRVPGWLPAQPGNYIFSIADQVMAVIWILNWTISSYYLLTWLLV